MLYYYILLYYITKYYYILLYITVYYLLLYFDYILLYYDIILLLATIITVYIYILYTISGNISILDITLYHFPKHTHTIILFFKYIDIQPHTNTYYIDISILYCISE